MNASLRISIFCEENELPPDKSMLISLSLEEMLLSIKDHCFPEDEEQDINVRILVASGDVSKASIVLRIRCGGAPFNPIDYYERQKTAAAGKPAEDNDLAGLLAGLDDAEGMGDLLTGLDDSLGIAMIVASAPVVDYKTTFGVNNLTIIL